MGGYFVCNFRSLGVDAARKPRKSRHNARGINSFNINDLCGGGARWIRTRDMFRFLTLGKRGIKSGSKLGETVDFAQFFGTGD